METLNETTKYCILRIVMAEYIRMKRFSKCRKKGTFSMGEMTERNQYIIRG